MEWVIPAAMCDTVHCGTYLDIMRECASRVVLGFRPSQAQKQAHYILHESPPWLSWEDLTRLCVL